MLHEQINDLFKLASTEAAKRLDWIISIKLRMAQVVAAAQGEQELSNEILYALKNDELPLLHRRLLDKGYRIELQLKEPHRKITADTNESSVFDLNEVHIKVCKDLFTV